MGDLSVNGPGSPISLKKFLDEKGPELRELTILVDGSNSGIAKDAEDCIYITPEECSKQAIYYSKELFKGGIPTYIYRYFGYLFLDKDSDFMDKSDGEIALLAVMPDEQTTKDIEFIKNLIIYCEQNKEVQQALGLIQLISGTLSMAKKANAGCRIYLEHPETCMHPKRQSRFMSVLNHIRNKYK